MAHLAVVGLEGAVYGGWASAGGAPSRGGGRGAFDGGYFQACPLRPGIERGGGGPSHGGPARMILGTRQFARWPGLVAPEGRASEGPIT